MGGSIRRHLPRAGPGNSAKATSARSRAVASPGTSRGLVLAALQRAAGNSAVSSWLRGAGAVPVQRDTKIPDDAKTLDKAGAALPGLAIDADAVSVSGRAWFFKNDRLPARSGIGVDIRFGGPMAADKTKEQAVENGLGSMGLIFFGLDGPAPKKKGEEDWGRVDPGTGGTPGKPRPPTTDLVHLVDLDLTAYGGQEGHYRFTAVTAKGTATAPKEVIILIELLGARRKDFDLKPASRQKAALDKRFDSFGFTKKDPQQKGMLDEPDTTMTWLDEQWARVLQALASMPDGILAGVRGIVWERGRGAKSAKGEAAFYTTKTGLNAGDTPERSLIIYDDAFKSDSVLVATVAHEIGHAVSQKPLEPKGGTAIYDTSDYKAAVRADGGQAITVYGRKDASEAYAEAYSMFIAEPATLKILRPNLFAWFEKQQQATVSK
jgi:hypothetical protein